MNYLRVRSIVLNCIYKMISKKWIKNDAEVGSEGQLLVLETEQN